MEVLEKSLVNRITLRIQSDILESLKDDASKKDITLNAAINKLLSKSVTYDQTVSQVPHVIIPNDLFFAVLEQTGQKNLNDIAEKGPEIIKKLFDIIGINYTVSNVIDHYFLVVGKYCNWFDFTYKKSGSSYRLVFARSYNGSWSGFLQTYIRSILKSLNVIITDESFHDGMLVFEFSHKDHM